MATANLLHHSLGHHLETSPKLPIWKPYRRIALNYHLNIIDGMQTRTAFGTKLFDANPQYSWEMVKIEASPDGWSPLVSCRLVTRGWVLGF